MKNSLNFNNLLKLFASSPSFRLTLSLFGGMIINLVYISVNIASAFMYRNIWSGFLSFYHGLFLVSRLYLLYARRRLYGEEEIKNACLHVGVLMLFLDMSAMLIMVHAIRSDIHVSYSGVILLGFIAYTVYSLFASLRGMKKYANDNEPLHFAGRNITFASALMSVFNLQYSVLVTLGAEAYLIKRVLAAGGFTVFFLITILAVRLIVKNAL